jgi:magnesium transporter
MQLVETDDRAAADIVVYGQPTDVEKEDCLRLTDLDPLDLEAVYDTDEVPRIESTEESTFVIWKRPDNMSRGESLQFGVSSLGIVVRGNKAIFIVPRGELFMTGREFKRVESIWYCIFRVLLNTIHHYQGHLKAIKMMSQELQAKIITSMENTYLLQMFALSESLVYYYDALEANLTVLSKLRATVERQKLTPDQISLLDDVIIEDQQASKQAGIYSTVLSGLMDARGSIINNNMTILLKKLTIINVVFLPLNLVAGIGGMSEFSMMTQGVPWRVAYAALVIGMLGLGWFTWRWLVKVTDRSGSPIRKRR